MFNPPERDPFKHEFHATEIKQFKLCNRKWYFGYIAGKKQGTTKAMQLGTDVHDQLEHYLKGNRSLDLTTKAGNIASTGLYLLPKPKTPGVEIEKPWMMTSPYTGFKYGGRIDAVDWNVPRLIDHKTTSGKEWALTEKTIVTDVQAMLYSYYVLEVHRSTTLDLQWIYYFTKNNDRGTIPAHNLSLTTDRKHVEQQFRGIESTIKYMARIMQDAQSEKDVSPNWDACNAYGVCPYIGECSGRMTHILKNFLLPVESLRRTKEEVKMAFNKTKPGMPAAMDTVPEIQSPKVPEGRLVIQGVIPDVQVGKTYSEKSMTEYMIVPEKNPQATPIAQPQQPDMRVGYPFVLSPVQVNPPEQMSEEQFKEPQLKAFTLCIDCMPFGEKEILSLGEVFEKIRIEKFLPQGITSYLAVEYGKGKIELVKYVKEYLANAKFKYLFVDSRLSESLVCLPMLEASTNKIFRGTR